MTSSRLDRSPGSVEEASRAPASRYVSIVTPCLNEELTVGEFVDWCHEGLERAGVDGEVVIVDSSTDRSAEIAAGRGARVFRFLAAASAAPTSTQRPTYAVTG